MAFIILYTMLGAPALNPGCAGRLFSNSDSNACRAALPILFRFRSTLPFVPIPQTSAHEQLRDEATMSAECLAHCLVVIEFSQGTRCDITNPIAFYGVTYDHIVKHTLRLAGSTLDEPQLPDALAQLDVMNSLVPPGVDPSFLHAVISHHIFPFSARTMFKARYSSNTLHKTDPSRSLLSMDWYDHTVVMWRVMLQLANEIGIADLVEQATEAKILYLLEWWSRLAIDAQLGTRPLIECSSTHEANLRSFLGTQSNSLVFSLHSWNLFPSHSPWTTLRDFRINFAQSVIA